MSAGMAEAGGPRISVVMANYNAARFVEAALGSVLRQTIAALEIIVVDDASTDDGPDRIAALAMQDSRVRLIRLQQNVGPAACRNIALDHVGAPWIAIVDSDDLLHPARFERLLVQAETEGADIVADNMLVFDDADATPPHVLLRGRAARPRIVDAEQYIRANALFRRQPALGYLKPIMRAATLMQLRVRYDPMLRIAEDYDLIARLLVGGAKFLLCADLTYFYRKHGASISHRLHAAALEAMLAADDRFRSAAATTMPVQKALQMRRGSLLDALFYGRIIQALKRRDWRAAAGAALRRPGAALLLRLPLLARLQRALPRRNRAPEPAGRHICLISRQRIVGRTNGSSAYLLSICEHLRAHGLRIHLVCPNPAVFGRWPGLMFMPDMAVFDTIAIRGGLRIGRTLVVALDPRIAMQAGLTILNRLAHRFGLAQSWRVAAAPYAIGVPWSDADRVFVARQARRHADAVLADYAFLAEGIPYTLRPGAPNAIVMHDLFFRRASQFDAAQGGDSVAAISEMAELRLLAAADAIVAIQQDEAAYVHEKLPDRRVILAPMAARGVPLAQPGRDDVVLFVGSNTAPNILGLQWFLDECWPHLHAMLPGVELRVIGGVAGRVAAADGVALLGRVADLQAPYCEAGVVISPLQAGSGLKIKLIEALGQGKAVVATSITTQGVEGIVDAAVSVRDDAAGFVTEIIALLQDRELRRSRGEAAIAIVNRWFAAESCYGPLADYMGMPSRSADRGLPGSAMECDVP